MIQRSFLCVGDDLIGPCSQVGKLTQDVLDLIVGEQGRLGKLVLCQPELFFCTSAAFDSSFAEGTPWAGEILAFAFVGELGFGYQFVLCPCFEISDRDCPCADVLAPGLIDGHGDILDVVQAVEDPERTESVEHHLGISLRFDQNALPILEIDDVQGFIADDDTVTGSKSVRDIAAEVEALLDVDHGIRAVLPGFGKRFKDELHIVVRVHIHLVTVVLGDRLPSRPQLQRSAELMLTQRMCGGAFGGGFRLLVFKLQLQPRRWRAVEPAVRGGGRQKSVFGWRHQSTSAS